MTCKRLRHDQAITCNWRHRQPINIQVMKSPRKPATERAAKQPTKAAIRRAVASSTAIETGQRISRLESKLRAGDSKFRYLKLAP